MKYLIILMVFLAGCSGEPKTLDSCMSKLTKMVESKEGRVPDKDRASFEIGLFVVCNQAKMIQKKQWKVWTDWSIRTRSRYVRFI